MVFKELKKNQQNNKSDEKVDNLLSMKIMKTENDIVRWHNYLFKFK